MKAKVARSLRSVPETKPEFAGLSHFHFQPEDRPLQKRILENPLLTAVPTGTQDDFLGLTAFIQLYSGANWVGKTSVVILKIATLHFRPTQNRFLAQHRHLFEFPQNARGRIVAPHSLIATDVIPTLRAWLPRGRYSATKGVRAFESQWKLDTGGEFDIMTYDQQPEEFEGTKLDWAFFNEPPPQRILAATIARMKPHGIIMIGMTPLSGAGYLFDRINSPFATHSWGIVYADIESACIEHGIRGYLPHAAIEKKIAEYDPDERDARVKGLPMHLSGRVYKTFSRQLHVVPAFPIPPNWTVWQITDPHDRRPFAMGWYAVPPKGEGPPVCFDEWPNDPFHEMKSCSMTVKEYAALIREKEAEHAAPTRFRIIDARFCKRKDKSNAKTLQEMFDEEGISYDPAYTGEIETGHQEVKKYLKPHAAYGDRPGILYFDTCRNHIYGFEHYVWTDPTKVDLTLKEKVKEQGKDFPDLTRYFVMDEPRYVEPVDTIVTVPVPKTWPNHETAEATA